MYELPYDQDINKYSIYVHLQPEWRSHPRNILFDVTTVWDNPDKSNITYQSDELDNTIHNFNQLEYLGEKSFVRLNHQYSDCQASWRPILYRLAIDTVGNQIDYYQGNELSGDPYTAMYPDIRASGNPDTRSGFIQFLPLCTVRDNTSYEYSVKINGDAQFDAYFVPSTDEVDDYVRGVGFDYYDGCDAQNYQSWSGSCSNVPPGSGLMIAIPDTLSIPLTKVKVTLHEIQT